MEPKKIYLLPRSIVDLIVALYQENNQIFAIEVLPCETKEARDDCLDFFGAITGVGTEKASIRIGKDKTGTNFVLTLLIGESCREMRKRQYELTKEMANQLAWLRQWSESRGQNGGAIYISNGAGFILRKNTN